MTQAFNYQMDQFNAFVESNETAQPELYVNSSNVSTGQRRRGRKPVRGAVRGVQKRDTGTRRGSRV